MQSTYLLTVKQFSQKHPAFRVGGLRHQIFNERSNGLAESGAILRLGRRVLIDEAKYFDWIQAQNKCCYPHPDTPVVHPPAYNIHTTPRKYNPRTRQAEGDAK